MQSGRGFEYGVFHILSHRNGPLSEVIHEKLELTLAETNDLIQRGAVYVEQKRCIQDTAITVEQLVRVHTKPRRFTRPVAWHERVLHETTDFVIVDKPSGLPCHPTVDNLQENLLIQLKNELGYPLYLT